MNYLLIPVLIQSKADLEHNWLYQFPTKETKNNVLYTCSCTSLSYLVSNGTYLMFYLKFTASACLRNTSFSVYNAPVRKRTEIT